MEVKPYINLDDIPESLKKELEKTNATQLDLLLVRSGLAENKAEAKKIKGLAIANRDRIEAIDSKFYVTVKNGEEKKVHISDLILEMYERETNRRHLGLFRKLVQYHKWFVVVITFSILIIGIVSRHQIFKALEWLSSHVFDLLKLIF